MLSLTGCDSGPFVPSLQEPQSDLLSCDARMQVMHHFSVILTEKHY